MKLDEVRARYVEPQELKPEPGRCGNCTHLLDDHIHDNCGLCDVCWDCVLLSAPYGHDLTKPWDVKR